MKPGKLILISILALIFFSNCKKESIPGPAGPSGSAGPSGNLTGDIVGYISVYDLNENLLTDFSGVTVTLEGTTYSATSEKNGRFVLSHVTAGTYNVAYSKPGYGTTRFISFKFVGGGQDYLVANYLHPTPLYYPTNLTVSSGPSVNPFTGNTIASLKVTLNGSLPNKVYMTFFIDTIAGVSSKPGNFIISGTHSGPISSSKEFMEDIYSDNLTSHGIKSGQNLYIICYADGLGTYWDPNSNSNISSNLNPIASNTLIIKVP
jgi:hypothetical protein